MIGRSLRQYRITASLGRGGMGEVWLASDTTLGREVAIKTLPAGGGADAETRKERFFREARAASALNHPNIITIYEINSDQDVDFIAMEHVHGRTLAEMLERGPLPIDQVRRIALQIAEAVGQAHLAGIVHRDLKPRNIMVRYDGHVKVLDFGLAKLTHASADGAANAATQVVLTRIGTTVGTLGYMSPEQAIGDPVDARSDVFSFGVILYEMLTGRLPFSGRNFSDSLQQLHFAEPPPIESLRPDVPAALRNVVSRTLRKRPDDRFANMSEVSAALSARPSTGAAPATAAAAAPPVPPVPPPPVRRGTGLAVAGVLVMVLAVLASAAVWRSRTQVPPAASNQAPAVQASLSPTPPAVHASDKPAAQSADANADRGKAQVPAPPPAAKPAVQPVEAGATTHVHWGRLGDAHRAEARQADAEAAYRRAIELVGQQLATTPGDADLESWRALYLAKAGDRANAVAAIDPLVKRTDLAADVIFRMAVVYELSGARQRALTGVALAVKAGYPVRAVATEPELAALRSDPRFQRLANTAPAKKRPARR